MLLTTEQLISKIRLKEVNNLLRSATGDDRAELLEEKEELERKMETV